MHRSTKQYVIFNSRDFLFEYSQLLNFENQIFTKFSNFDKIAKISSHENKFSYSAGLRILAEDRYICKQQILNDSGINKSMRSYGKELYTTWESLHLMPLVYKQLTYMTSISNTNLSTFDVNYQCNELLSISVINCHTSS